MTQTAAAPRGRRHTLHRILVATDFSPGASLALARAGRLPSAAHGAITVLHVMPARAEATEITAVRRALNQAAATIRAARRDAGAPVVGVHTRIAHGKPFVEILRAAREVEAELIVLGRHGARTFPKLVLGSTAERVVRAGSTAVLVVKSDPAGPYRRPLVAVDGSETSRHAFDAATRLVAREVGTVEIVHAYEPPYERMLKLRGGLSEEQLRPHRAYARNEAHALVDDFVAALGWRGNVRIDLRRGDPRSVILRVAKQRNADLLALGTGRARLERTLIGSVAEAVARVASCDVLVARSSMDAPRNR